MGENHLDEFLFIRSEKIEEEKGIGRGRKGEYTPYVSEIEEIEWTSKSMEDQITSTISIIQDKLLKDDENIYIVLGISKSLNLRDDGTIGKGFRIFTPDVSNVLKRLSAKVLAYLNLDHNRVLITCSLSNLLDFRQKEKYNRKYFKPIKRISPLLLQEKISFYLQEDEEWESVEKPLIIQLIPNISRDKRSEYIRRLTEYFQEFSIEFLDYDEQGNIIANLNKESTTRFLENTNFIFKVSEVPKGLLERDFPHSLDEYLEKQESNVKPENSPNSNTENLPTICLLDSGVNDIVPLNNILIQKDGHALFANYEDGHESPGHGTPIACLASLGEELKDPKVKIISYKIFSDSRRDLLLRGMQRGITRYSDTTRLFLSSIVFEHDNPWATVLIERLVQARNICIIMSGGNICKTDILDCIANGNQYPQYNYDYPISDPCQALSIIAVGAISKQDSPSTIARHDGLAPFSRCGTKYPTLFSCPKPELVQDGGNLCYNGDAFGGLVSYDKNGVQRNEFIGTSFAAPLLARRLALIEERYGNKIENAETFKAILLASSNRSMRSCIGYGETHYYYSCDRFHSLLVTEGTLALPFSSRPDFKIETSAEIYIRIPRYTKSIELILVHSDNGSRTPIPSLNTYLKVFAKKTGNETGYVRPINPEDKDKKTHMKVLKWQFKRKSMESDWTFIIKPDVTAEMLDEHKKEITIRYGCAILVTSKTTSLFSSLTDEIKELMADRLL